VQSCSLKRLFFYSVNTFVGTEERNKSKEATTNKALTTMETTDSKKIFVSIFSILERFLEKVNKSKKYLNLNKGSI
jgi:hypothetical protein